MAQKIAAELGVGVGIFSGANFLAALQVQNELGSQAALVTVFPDDNKKYLSTDLMRAEPRKDAHLAPDIDLMGVRAFKRVCYTCCDPEEYIEADSLVIATEMSLPYCARRP